MRETFHLVPEAVWTVAAADLPYAAASLESEGFIHCTDGVDRLSVTFDRYYAADERAFLALTLDLDALEVPWRYDAPGSPYPHIYGPIKRSAIVGLSCVVRLTDGRFSALTPTWRRPDADLKTA